MESRKSSSRKSSSSKTAQGLDLSRLSPLELRKVEIMFLSKKLKKHSPIVQAELALAKCWPDMGKYVSLKSDNDRKYGTPPSPREWDPDAPNTGWWLARLKAVMSDQDKLIAKEEARLAHLKDRRTIRLTTASGKARNRKKRTRSKKKKKN